MSMLSLLIRFAILLGWTMTPIQCAGPVASPPGCSGASEQIDTSTALWETLVRDGKQPDAELVLQSRLEPNSATSGETITLVIVAKNVSRRTVWFEPRDVTATRVLIRDETGKIDELDIGGHTASIPQVRNGPAVQLQPGSSSEITVSLTDYFRRSAPGKYAILAIRRSGTKTESWSAARPLAFALRKPLDQRHKKDKKRAETIIRPSPEIPPIVGGRL